MTKHKRCKGICKTGNRCKYPAEFEGYCVMHYKVYYLKNNKIEKNNKIRDNWK